MSILERCPSYKESNKGNKQRQGPTLGVRFTEVSVKRELTVLPLGYVIHPLSSVYSHHIVAVDAIFGKSSFL